MEEPRVDMELKCQALNVTEMEANGRDVKRNDMAL
jgi:hypothetical protein